MDLRRRHNNAVRTVLAAAGLFCLVSCAHYDFVREVKAQNYAMVKKETYFNWTEAMASGGPYAGLVQELRREIERDSFFLGAIAGRYFPVAPNVRFQFKFSSPDSLKQSLCLRYFTPVAEHPEIAGYHVFFAFEIKAKRLTGIYVSEVPLE